MRAHHTITHSETKAWCVHTEAKPSSPQQSELLIIELNYSVASILLPINFIGPLYLHTVL